jgi:SpoIID/LytB domain protein
VRVFSSASRGRLAVAGLVSLGLLGATLVLGSAPSASASGLDTVGITGHGYGHGRGMGQYGAYGYALQGWSDQQILSYYYSGGTQNFSGGVVAGSIGDPPINVVLDEFGPTATITNPPTGDATVVQGSLIRHYRGTVSVVDGQVVNHVSLEDYVEGVVPAESPASWGTNGEPSLQAQAVAARSYAWADTHGGTTSICDTTACQVYDGDADVAGAPTHSGYQQYSDTAQQSTAGEILLCGSDAACGAPSQTALTEFSSSTGGYTAGGAFPAVVDNGDDSATGNGNPNHTWTATLNATSVDAAYPSIGALTSVAVTGRNGLGDMGGRVTTMTVTGTNGTVSTSGSGFAAALGLKSNWFSFTGSTGASGGDNGYWIVAADGSVTNFGDAPSYGSMVGQHLNGSVVAMAPTADQAGYWLVGSDGGIFSFGDAAFYGSTGNLRLNRPVLGMAATTSGHGYWLFASDGGIFSFGDAAFHGSTGDLKLNQPIVGMAATPDGGGYWLVAADGGIFSFGDAGFYGSTGGIHLNQPIVGMVPTADGRGYTLVARDGGVFAFGDAAFDGSLPGLGISAKVASVAPTADGGGYLVVATNGAVYGFGDAPNFGGMSAVVPGWTGTALGIFAHMGS